MKMFIKMLVVVVAVNFVASKILYCDEILSKELVKENKKAVEELTELVKTDPQDVALLRELGKAYFNIGSESADRKSISQAMKIFKQILKKDPNDAEIMTYYGSCWTIKARDFPLKWIVSFTPIGFVRIYYVKKGVSIMDKAVSMEPKNPFVRIVYAITCYNIPAVFGQFYKSKESFSLLVSWIENPESNPEYKDLFKDETFQSVVYYHTAEMFLMNKEVEKAKMLIQKILSIKTSSIYKDAAMRMLEKLD